MPRCKKKSDDPKEKRRRKRSEFKKRRKCRRKIPVEEKPDDKLLSSGRYDIRKFKSVKSISDVRRISGTVW